MSRALKAHLLLIGVTLIWGATFVVIKNALADASPLLFNAIRMCLAAACLAAMFPRELPKIPPATLRMGAVCGAWLWAGYEFQTTGLRLTTASKSGFLTGVSVVLVPVFLAMFFRRRVNSWTVAGIAVAFLGLTLMTVPAGGLAALYSVNRGDLLTLGCATAFAFQIIFLGRATRAHPFRQIAFLQTAIAAVLMVVTAPLAETPHLHWTGRLIIAIVVTGVFGTALAFAVQAWAQQFTPPTHTALIFVLEPVFAWLTSLIVLHERLGARAGVGAALIICGVLLSEWMGAKLAPDDFAQAT